MAASSAFKVAVFTSLAMVAFAANSVLNRLALAEGEIDALTYSGARLGAGALMLAGILVWRGASPRWGRIGGSTAGAVALGLYAVCFSYAYLDLGAGTGALILFAAVQFGMLGWAIGQGDRPGTLEWAGFGAAILFLVLLLAPGLTAPEPTGAVLMMGAGFAWAAYSLIGRRSVAPLIDTGGNFLRCLPLALLMLLPGLLSESTSLAGWLYAIASGALASGLGYAVWYSVLPALERSTAAYVQLTVPAIAAAGGVLILAEPLTPRLLLCSLGILGGVGLALWGGEKRRRAVSRAA
ncbi:MAG: DMT family transporter [Gemmobacter sp.]|jgi:drug/metabolite transporter (DMT)-like permease|nr:DMT family transporter [Gemmobacter sp.]